MEKQRALGVLLCYNDGDILGEQIEYLLGQNHDLVVWDHGSDDNTAAVLDRYDTYFVQRGSSRGSSIFTNSTPPCPKT